MATEPISEPPDEGAASTEPAHVDPRNRLAAIRTDLANERTLLAYVRTALMLVGTGGMLIKFFGNDSRLLMTGYASLGVGASVLWLGIIQFRRAAARVRHHVRR
ncbi:MAG: DUF202 domain-containing protein [Planctomycetota bacterium]